jgi:hypothetical protein
MASTSDGSQLSSLTSVSRMALVMKSCMRALYLSLFRFRDPSEDPEPDA